MIRAEDNISNNKMTDIHNHIIWGFDDGPRSPEVMYAMIDQAYEQGIGLIFATSHAYPRHKVFHLDQYYDRLNEANEYCKEKGYDLRILQGSEINYSQSVPNGIVNGIFPCMAGSRWVLLEFYPDSSIENIKEAVDEVFRYGYKPIIAHVERYLCLSRYPKKAIGLREKYSAMFQVNCETILNPRGLIEKRFIRKMLDARAIDIVASDAHDNRKRPFMLKKAYEKLVKMTDAAYASELVRFGWKII